MKLSTSAFGAYMLRPVKSAGSYNILHLFVKIDFRNNSVSLYISGVSAVFVPYLIAIVLFSIQQKYAGLNKYIPHKKVMKCQNRNKLLWLIQ